MLNAQVVLYTGAEKTCRRSNDFLGFILRWRALRNNQPLGKPTGSSFYFALADSYSNTTIPRSQLEHLAAFPYE